MNTYYTFMAEQIATEIKSIEDPMILSIYLKAIVAQRCKIGGAKEGSCEGCTYQCYNCRQLNDVCNRELAKLFNSD